VLSAAGILDVGIASQIRAGRQLSPADFAAIGLNAPIALWNLSDLSDASGNGRALSNKGAVPFASGINGTANTAAQFAGSVAQALYIADAGAADPFRIKTGSVGCWARSAKRGVFQMLVDKYGAANQQVFSLYIHQNNYATWGPCPDGSNNNYAVAGTSDVVDDRWHFFVGTVDGSMAKLYVDGILEATGIFPSALFSGSSVLNIGGRAADSATAAVFPHFGRIDEAFIAADVLSDDQVRNLYCAKIAHTLGAVPARIALNVRRRKKGGVLAVADFPTQPLRLHNFSAGSLGDQGSNNQTLTNAAVPPALSVAGVDGSTGNAYSFAGSQALTATDTGLPSGVATRSYGCWFKTVGNTINIMAWGQTPGTNDSRLVIDGTVKIQSWSGTDPISGTFVGDGQWHFVVVTEDNAAIDSAKRKLYLDGRLIGISTTMVATVLGGASYFRIAANSTGGGAFTGQIDGVFVCDYVLTAANIAVLYAKGSQTLSPSPKNVGDHVEGMDAANLYAIFDALETQHQIDLAVA
jgi:hypothetical protein